MTTGQTTVRHEGGDRFSISVRGHDLHVDQPVDKGGEDTAPTLTELFVASLAAGVAFYARRRLRRHGLPEAALTVDSEFELAAHPARVGRVRLDIRLPEGVPDERRKGLLAVASHCTVHNTLNNPPDVQVRLAGAEVAPTSGASEAHSAT